MITIDIEQVVAYCAMLVLGSLLVTGLVYRFRLDMDVAFLLAYVVGFLAAFCAEVLLHGD